MQISFRGFTNLDDMEMKNLEKCPKCKGDLIHAPFNCGTFPYCPKCKMYYLEEEGGDEN